MIINEDELRKLAINFANWCDLKELEKLYTTFINPGSKLEWYGDSYGGGYSIIEPVKKHNEK